MTKRATPRYQRRKVTRHVIAVTPTGFRCSCRKAFPAAQGEQPSVIRLVIDVSIDGLNRDAVDALSALLGHDGARPESLAARHQLAALLQEPLNGGKAIVINCLGCSRESTLFAVPDDRAVIAFAEWLRTPCGGCRRTPIEVAEATA